MSTRYHVQIEGEPSPRGPLSGFTLLKMFERGEITSNTAVCAVGDQEWQTVDWYWTQLQNENGPRQAAPARPAAVVQQHPLAPPAVSVPQFPPLPVWRVVYGVCFFVGSFTSFGWALVGMIYTAALPSNVEPFLFFVAAVFVGTIEFLFGYFLTARKE
jgi:hypothetical protein